MGLITRSSLADSLYVSLSVAFIVSCLYLRKVDPEEKKWDLKDVLKRLDPDLLEILLEIQSLEVRW